MTGDEAPVPRAASARSPGAASARSPGVSSGPRDARSILRLIVVGRLGPADVATVCGRLGAALAASEVDPVECDLASLVGYDIATVDAMARLTMAGRRFGRSLRFVEAPLELRELVDLAGLATIVSCDDPSVEPGRQAEEGKEVRGVEEERDPADAAAVELEDLQ
ncbi:MAG TPA: STAS domain-containing protein [Candidatus Limnocylindrales bacterium]